MNDNSAGAPASSRQRLKDLISAAQKQAAAAGSSGHAGRELSAEPAAFPDGVFVGYELLGELHRGGQGVVYRATQKATRRSVAIKVLREGPFAGPAEKARFEREVQILGALRHPNIVTIHESGSAAGLYYFTMDYIAGQALDAHIATVRPDVAQTLRIFQRVCEAVEAAHLLGIVHRDLKPSNIRIDEEGRPHVLDFGLARTMGLPGSGGAGSEIANNDFANSDMTATGQFVGSLPWASPEQARGDRGQVDMRSDVYSIGVMLYQMLTGRFPYDVAGNLGDALRNIQHSEPVRPRSLRRDVNDEVETIVLKCLNKEPPRRYQTAGELSRDIGRYLTGEPIEAKRDSAMYVLRKTMSRHRGRFGALGAFALLVLGAGVALGIMYARQGLLLAQVRTASARAQTELHKYQQTANFTREMLSGVDPEIAGGMDKRLMRMILDRAAQRVDRELAAAPEVEWAVRETIGRSYSAIGDYAAAASHLERALQIRRTLGSEDDAEVLALKSVLGMVYRDAGRLNDAQPLLDEVLAARIRLLGERHRETLDSMNDLAQLYDAQGRLQDAEQLCDKTLKLRTEVLGPRDPDTLSSMNNMATIYGNLGRLEQAQPLFEQVVELSRDVHGPEHAETIGSEGSLAQLYMQIGRTDDAEKLFESTLEQETRVFGEEHPVTLITMSNLANLYAETDRVDQAEALFRRSLELERRTLGNDHPRVATRLFSIADIVRRRDPVAAEPLYVESLDIFRKALPADHPQIGAAEIGLGVCLSAQERFEEAEMLLLSGFEQMKGKPGAEEWERQAIDIMIRFYKRWDKPDVAAEWKARRPTSQPSGQPPAEAR